MPAPTQTRVLVLGPLNSPNVESMAVAMRDAGHEVVAAGHRSPYLPAAGIEREGIPVAAERDRAATGRSGLEESVPWLWNVVAAVRPDVIHAHQLHSYPAVAAAAGVGPLVATVWGSDVFLRRDELEAANRIAVEGADAITVHAPHIRDRLLELGADPQQLVDIRWGVDLDLFRPGSEDPAELRRRLGLGPGRVVFSPRATRGIYNLDVVLESFALLADELDDVQLILKPTDPSGDAPKLERFRHADRVHVAGRVTRDAMADYYRAADVCISVPSSDGSPNSVWEALACGTPCVLSDLPWLQGMIEPEVDALVVPIDPPAIAGALRRVLEEPELSAAISQQGRALVEAEHDCRVHMGRLSELYAELASRGQMATRDRTPALRVCMLVYNSVTNDSRVFREARALAARGHTVEVIGWKGRGLAEFERRDGFTIRRIRRNPRSKRSGDAIRRLRARLARLPGDVLRRLIPALRGRWPPPQERRLHRTEWSAPQRSRSLPHKELMVRDWWKRVLRFVDGRRFDVIHAHDLNTLPLAAEAARRANARLVYDSHELFIERGMIGPLERRLWRRRESRLIGRANRVITVCEPIAQELLRRYSIERPLILMNCPELPQTPLSGDPERLRAKVGLDGATDEPIVLYQGMVQPERGLETLIDAAVDLDRGIVVIMGKGVSQAKLQARIDAAGVGDRVHLTGPVPPEQLLDYTAGATIGVAPIEGHSLNYYYAAPNKLFEYLAAGLPVVATRLPVMEQVLTEHDAGLLFEPGDAAGLAAAINRLLSDEELRARLGHNALEASKTLNWERESQKLLALYDELAEAASD